MGKVTKQVGRRVDFPNLRVYAIPINANSHLSNKQGISITVLQDFVTIKFFFNFKISKKVNDHPQFGTEVNSPLGQIIVTYDIEYHISSYSFLGKYSFLNLEIVENLDSSCPKFQFFT